MKRMELQAFLRIAYFAAVEKVGRIWGTREVVGEAKEKEGVGREAGWFGGENMGDGSTGLARE